MAEVKIERNIIECFSYLLNLEFFFGSNRVAVKDRVVSTPNGRQNLYSLLLFFGSTFSQIYYVIFYYSEYFYKDSVLFITSELGQLTPYVSYVTCLLVARFANQSDNIAIFTKLQNIDRILGLQHDRYFTKFQARIQNFLTTLMVILVPLGIFGYAIEVVDKPLYTIFLGPTYLTVYLDLVLFGGLLYYICVRVSVLIKLLKNQIRRLEDEPQEDSPFLIRLILSLIYPNIDSIGDRSTLEPHKWVESIEEVMKAYLIITNMFSYQILTVTATLFLWTFLVIGNIASAMVTMGITVTVIILVATWVIFFFVLLTGAAILNDWFLYQVKRTKWLCVRIMYYDYDDISWKAAKRILQTINRTDPKFIVYGVFTLNSGLILTLIMVIATNVVVVIQFAVSNDKSSL